MKNKGLVLLSGGIDSAVTAWIADKECDELYAITFRYGQTHEKEIGCALTLGSLLGVIRHKVFDIPLSEIGGSALFNKDKIPTEEVEGVPSTWVPQRNTIFLAIAYAWAEVLGVSKVYIGVNYIDYSGYPDCRPEFIIRIGEALNLASKKYVESGNGISLITPLLYLSKKEIIELGIKLGVPFRYTTSCYLGEELACGKCPSCLIRMKAFREAGIEDPIRYGEGK